MTKIVSASLWEVIFNLFSTDETAQASRVSFALSRGCRQTFTAKTRPTTHLVEYHFSFVFHLWYISSSLEANSNETEHCKTDFFLTYPSKLYLLHFNSIPQMAMGICTGWYPCYKMLVSCLAITSCIFSLQVFAQNISVHERE